MSLSTRTRRLGSQVLTILVAALVAGVFVPRVVAASTSTGDRAIFEPLAPARILDTRDGTGAPAAKVGPGQTIDVPVLGQGGVPADATAVVINLTVTQPSAEIRDKLRAAYEQDSTQLIASSQVIAIHFQTVAAANNYWRE